MEEGEMEFFDSAAFLNCSDITGFDARDELLKNTHTCTHTHTCNLSDTNTEHTHACYHTHMQVFASADEEYSVDKFHRHHDPPCRKRPAGNREAVKKYREKKKAQTAYLEEEVSQLKLLNQQLMKKLQSQLALEAEMNRLRALLSEIRGRIDGGLANFSSHNTCADSTRLLTDSASSVVKRNYPNGLDCQRATDVSIPHSPVQPDANSHH